MAELRKWHIIEKPKEKLEDLQLFTKWCPSPEPMPADVVAAAVERSLTRMATDSLDLMQFHWWDYDNDQYLIALKHMQNLQSEGKIKYLALTNFDTERLRKMYKNGIKIVSNQVSYSIIDRRPEKEMVPFCLENDIKLLTYGTLLGGLLSEKWIGVAEPISRDKLNTSSLGKYKKFIDHWGPWTLFQELLVELKKIADHHKVAIANVATYVRVDAFTAATHLRPQSLRVGQTCGRCCHHWYSTWALRSHRGEHQDILLRFGSSRDLRNRRHCGQG